MSCWTAGRRQWGPLTPKITILAPFVITRLAQLGKMSRTAVMSVLLESSVSQMRSHLRPGHVLVDIDAAAARKSEVRVTSVP